MGTDAPIEVRMLVIGVYIVIFIVVWMFFEKRLDILHKRHVEKLAPLGEEGLATVDHRLKIYVRMLFALSFFVSLSIIITLI